MDCRVGSKYWSAAKRTHYYALSRPFCRRRFGTQFLLTTLSKLGKSGERICKGRVSGSQSP
ncbi:hypothetical protein SCLCIDRAFT_442372 [Scleroderma citrinum Foug A]|uniref:Uncharacterized protein n=1 Tax=Scleroderma citrinum Foug A TaxID=1036808 RepID=A0A0C3EBD3_9AGAM|nr:hypothetical protein SCLCIDRAFT_442372 [Scleroderma citrinum Foug A]